MKPYYEDDRVTIHHGDALDVLRSLPDESVHAIVTDPPYGLGFMGRDWDSIKAAHLPPSAQAGDTALARMRTGKGPAAVAFDGPAFQAWCEAWTRECLRVLKPGGHMLAFGGTRTWHRLACAVEDAGFEVRDSIAWLYGSGFPKSHDVSKHIDRTQGAERPRTKEQSTGKGANAWKVEQGGQANHWIAAAKERGERTVLVANDDPITPAAERWQGWGTALKPAFEPIVVARKPLSGTVASNVLQHGTGALNIDGCRVEGGARPLVVSDRRNGNEVYGDGLQGSRAVEGGTTAGRWPTNVVLDDSQAAELDRQSGELSVNGPARYTRDKDDAQRDRSSYVIDRPAGERPGFGDTGGASRFFPTFRYEAKAPTSERPRYQREGVVGGESVVAHPT